MILDFTTFSVLERVMPLVYFSWKQGTSTVYLFFLIKIKIKNNIKKNRYLVVNKGKWILKKSYLTVMCEKITCDKDRLYICLDSRTELMTFIP